MQVFVSEFDRYMLKTSQKAWYFVVFDTPVKTELKKSLDTADIISNINVLTVDSRSN